MKSHTLLPYSAAVKRILASAACALLVGFQAAAEAADEMPAFSIFEYTVDGNSLLPELSVENAVSPFMGESKTLRDVERARAALERAYHDAGYMTVLVSIPEQSVDSGTVQLHVTEASIDRLTVKGAEYTLPSNVKSGVPELAEGSVPNFNTMQAELTTLNRGADSRITPVLRAGKTPGTVEVQLDVEDQLPLHGSVELSNRQTPYTTSSLRMSASARYDNLWQRGHSVALTMQLAPEHLSDQRVLAGNYVIPVGSAGGALALSAVHSRSNFALLANETLGNSDTFSMRYSSVLGSAPDYSHSLAFGFDHKHVLQGQTSSSPFTYIPLVGSYSVNLPGQVRSSALSLTASSGMSGFFGNNDAAFNAQRPGTTASASFLALKMGLEHTETISRWALYGRIDAQLSSAPLVPTEQFIAGGVDSVRGYLEGEQSGDSGLRGSIELRSPQVGMGGQGSAWRGSGLVFLEGARLEVRQPVGSQPDSTRLASTGFGLRLSAPHSLTLQVDAAYAFLNGVSDLNNGGYFTPAGKKRLNVRSQWAF
jgi:hemolysin activation/secretion protein